MPRHIDHLVICVRDLGEAEASHGLALEFVEQGAV
jgi:hypothetical protein